MSLVYVSVHTTLMLPAAHQANNAGARTRIKSFVFNGLPVHGFWPYRKREATCDVKWLDTTRKEQASWRTFLNFRTYGTMFKMSNTMPSGVNTGFCT